MADIVFDCPECGGNLVVDEKGAGRKVPCPHCQQTIQIPAPSEAKAEENNDATMIETALVACPNCGVDNEPTASKCIRCGKGMVIGGHTSTQVGVPISDTNENPTSPKQGNNPAPRTCSSCGCKYEPDTVICVNCGVNLLTGQKINVETEEGESAAEKASASGNKYILAIPFIVAMFLVLLLAVNSKNNKQGSSVSSASAQDSTMLLDAQIKAAQDSKTYPEGIAILEKAISAYPDLPNTSTARALLESFREEFRQAVALAQQIDAAQQQTNYPDAISVLQSGLRDYPRAGNRQTAINLLNLYQQQLSAAIEQQQQRQRRVQTGAIGGGILRFSSERAAENYAAQMRMNNQGSMDAMREQAMMTGGGVYEGSSVLLTKYRVLPDVDNPGYWLVVPYL